MPNTQGRDVVMGDGLVDQLAKITEAYDILPACITTLRAGWTTPSSGCRSCGRRVRGSKKVMDPNARNRFRRCLIKANPADVQRLKALLGVDSITVYDRSDGKLKTTKL